MRRRRDRRQESTGIPGFSEVVEIGRGALAVVLEATEIDTARPVALKLLRIDTLPPFAAEALDDALKVLGRVSGHPNIVTFYRRVSTPDHRPVLVLELCPQSLDEQVRRAGPFDAPTAVAIGIKLCGALETAHRAGLLHRDVKPQNVLVTPFGEPALADLGLAALSAAVPAEEATVGLGNRHAPPELLEGRELSAATDVYGLASTLYQLMTGKAPFDAFEGEAPATVILRILTAPVTPLRAVGIPMDLADLLERCLAKDPFDRLPTAAALGRALRDVEAAAGWTPTPLLVWGAGEGEAEMQDGPEPAVGREAGGGEAGGGQACGGEARGGAGTSAFDPAAGAPPAATPEGARPARRGTLVPSRDRRSSLVAPAAPAVAEPHRAPAPIRPRTVVDPNRPAAASSPEPASSPATASSPTTASSPATASSPTGSETPAPPPAAPSPATPPAQTPPPAPTPPGAVGGKTNPEGDGERRRLWWQSESEGDA